MSLEKKYYNVMEWIETIGKEKEKKSIPKGTERKKNVNSVWRN